MLDVGLSFGRCCFVGLGACLPPLTIETEIPHTGCSTMGGLFCADNNKIKKKVHCFLSH